MPVSDEALAAYVERRLFPREAAIVLEELEKRGDLHRLLLEAFPELFLDGKLHACCHCHFLVIDDVGCSGCQRPLCATCAYVKDGDEYCLNCRDAIRH